MFSGEGGATNLGLEVLFFKFSCGNISNPEISLGQNNLQVHVVGPREKIIRSETDWYGSKRFEVHGWVQILEKCKIAKIDEPCLFSLLSPQALLFEEF